VPVDVHHIRSLFEDAANFARESDTSLLVGPVDLGDERLQYGRPGGDFRPLDRRAEPAGHRHELGPDTLRDLVALLRTFTLSNQVDLKVGQMRPAAQEVVPYEPIEVVGGRGA